MNFWDRVHQRRVRESASETYLGHEQENVSFATHDRLHKGCAPMQHVWSHKSLNTQFEILQRNGGKRTEIHAGFVRAACLYACTCFEVYGYAYI